MPDVVTLKKIESCAAALRQGGVKTIGDLQECIGVDVSSGLSWVANATRIERSLLLALLIAGMRDETRHNGKPALLRYWRGLKPLRLMLKLSASEFHELDWRDRLRLAWIIPRQMMLRQLQHWKHKRRYWPDLLLFVILPLGLIGLGWRAVALSRSWPASLVVKRGVSLPRFHSISRQELELKSVPGGAATFTDVEAVEGRYTLEALAPNTALQAKHLLSAELSRKMKDRTVLSVPVQAGDFVSKSAAPQSIILLLSPREPDKTSSAPVILDDVIFLGVEGSGETTSAIVAMKADDIKAASGLLATSSIFLSQHAR
ncbi:MAG TPA: hypothetical protein VF553_15050 [Pyrinomonadaceae bacterium]|jgi:hypothetical protein